MEMPSGKLKGTQLSNNISEQTQNLKMQSKRKRIVKSIPNDFEKFTAPTFNIHIHVPPCSSKFSKVYLPRIQPVIHLHFDKLLSGLEINEKSLTNKVIKKTLKNFIDATLPRVGDVKLHFENNLKESDLRENEISNVTQNSSECQNNDTELNKNEGLQKIQKDISRNIESVTSSSIIHDNENNKSYKVPANYWLDNDLKSRKAVVVLTDISKDKNYKDLFAAAKTNNSLLILSNKDDFSCDDVRTDQAQQMNKTVIKEENEFSEFPIKNESESEIYFSQDSFLDTCNNVSTKEFFDNKFIDKVTGNGNSSLISLAEGCSFSEILTKFKIKYNRNNADSLKIADSSTENETNFEIGNTEEGNIKIVDRKTSDETDYKNISNFNDIICTGFNKNKSDVMNNEHFNGNNSLKEVMGVSFLSRHDNIKNINLNGSESNLCDLNIKQEFKFSLRDNTVTVFNSDESNTVETTTKNGLSSEKNVTDLDIVEPKSFSISQLLLNEFDAPDMNKEMSISANKYTEKSVSIKKKEYETESSSSSSKKMKCSDEKAEKSGKKIMKPSSAEDYIILNEAGPTKFAVAPLDKMKSCKRHPAENFKNEMLYGNRVQRFSSSQHLAIYKAKNASRKFNK